MAEFAIEISPGNTITKEADSLEDAIKMVKADMASAAFLPEYDQLMFDYESGVPNIKGLRSKLGRVEIGPKMIPEQDAILQNIVGAKGFTRNSKGQIALTPEGMKELGLDYKTIELSDGSVRGLNTIIDERSFNVTGDLADFSGAVGPVLGAVLALSPQKRILGNVMRFFQGRPAFENMVRAAAGSALGEGAEEYVDLQEGFNLKNREEEIDNLLDEAKLGFAGQGIGELIGAGYRLLLGKNVPTDQMRLMNQAARKRSIMDIKKLDESLGREATEKEIKRAIKDGKVRMHSVGLAVSQQTLGRKLVGKSQAVSEEVLGNYRVKNFKEYLFQELDGTLKNINAERSALISYMDDSTKGALDEQVQARLRTLRNREQDVNRELERLFANISEDVLSVDLYGQTIGKEEVGELIKDTLDKTYKAVMKETGEKYRLLDGKISELSSPIKETISDRIYYVRVPEIEAIIKNFKNNNSLYDVNAQEDLANIVPAVERLIARWRGKYEDGQNIELVDVRNVLSTLKDLDASAIHRGHHSEILSKIIKKIDNGDVPKQFHDSILTDFEDISTFMRKTDAKGNPLFPPGKEPRLLKEEQKVITNILGDLRDANQLFRDRIRIFDSEKIKRSIGSIKNVKAFDPYDIYENVIKNGKDKDLKNVFAALDQYDDYLTRIGKASEATNSNDLRVMMQRKLFRDALREATEDATTPINFTTFAKEINRFKGQYPEKLDILFGNKGQQVTDVVNQINKLNPNLKPQEVLNLVDDITKTERGLFNSEAGLRFLDQLKTKAEASAARLRFEQNRVISDLPNIGVDEAVTKLFRPNSQENIEILKKTVSPEVFSQVQRVSMNKLLKKSIDLNGQGKITDVFKPGNLKNALDSYGDETLDAMFGPEVTRGLRQLQKTMDVLTAGEAGRGGAAGTLVAAGIAVNALNIGMLPTVAGLAVMRNIFSRPSVIALMTKTDKGSIAKLIQAFERAARQEGVRLIADEYANVGAAVGREVERGQESLEESGILDQLQKQGEEAFNQAQIQGQQLQNQARQIRTSQVDFPEIQPVQQFGGLAPERIEFAERIAGRPIV